jgi:hypothetical protein
VRTLLKSIVVFGVLPHCRTLSLLGGDFRFGPEEATVSKSVGNGSYNYRNHDFVCKGFEYATLKHCMRRKHFETLYAL